MEGKKDVKGVIWLIVILIVIILGMIGYIIYDKVFLNDNPQNNNTTSTTTKPKENVPGTVDIVDDLSEYSLLYWNYEEIYNYYFKMNDNETKINIDKYFKDVKVDNKKLYWNIDNQWISDKNIVDNVMYFNMAIGPLGDEYFIVVTETSKIYFITFENICFYCEEDGETTSYISLTNELYSNFKYNEIIANGKIDKVSAKAFTECEGWNEYYFEIDNTIYVLNRTDYKLEKLDSFMPKRYKDSITDLHNTCNPGYRFPLNIELDGTIKGIVDSNNDLIKVKHYVSLVKDENDYYDIIVDKEDNLYIVDETSKTQSVSDKVKSFKYTKDEFGNEKLDIDLENNSNIIKEIKRS